MNSPERSADSISRPAIICLLGLLAGVIVLQRVRLMSAPLQGDICAYALIGHEMTHGRQLYSDLWERKPPLLYITFAAAELVAGYGPAEIVLLGIVCSLVSLLLIYQMGRSTGRGRLAGLLAAAFWMLLNCDLGLTANQPDPEVFINICLSSAFLLLLGWPMHRSWFAAIMLGICFSAATLFKHNTALTCGGLLAAHVLVPRSGRFRDRLLEALIAGGVICIAWLGVLGYFAMLHRADAFIDVLFRQNLSYSGNVSGNLGSGISLKRIFPSWMAWEIAPGILLLVLILSSVARRKLWPNPGWMLLLAWAIGAWAAISLLSYLSHHYYELWLPIGCVAGGWAGAALVQNRREIPGWIGYPALIAAIGFLFVRQGSDFLLSPGEWVNRQYAPNSIAEQNQLGRDLPKLLSPGEAFWELGDDNALYFFAKESPPSGLLFIDPFLYGKETDRYWHRLLGDLNRSQPTLVVLSQNTMLFAVNAPIFPWLKQNYIPWNTALGFPHYRLLVKRGSDLERRLNNQQVPWVGAFFW